jgi:DNA ligase-1
MSPLQLADVAATAAGIAATSSRKAKSEQLAALLTSADSRELPVVVGFMVGEIRQGRIGVGWSTMAGIEGDDAVASTVTVLEVDEALTRVGALTGEGSRHEREQLLTGLFARLRRDEASFLRAVLTGGLRLGSLDGVMVDGIAKANGVPAAVVRRAVMLSGDLGAMAVVAATEGRSGLEAVGLQVGRGVQPMLAATSANVEAAVGEFDGPVSVQAKLDGIRVQAHKDGSEVRLFTRNLNDVTDRLPGVVELVRGLAAESVVLDGEVVGLAEDAPELFQDTASTFSSGGSSARVELVVRFFDLLHLDGVDRIDDPLTDRLATLSELVGDHMVDGIVTDDPAEAAAFNERVLAAGQEGVMVKDLASPYAAGRRGKTWRKVKPVHTYDLVVLGAEWGHGRRTGWLSNLHLGARDGDDFVMVGKTFKGLTDALLEWQTAALLEREERREGITVFVRPELVVEIAIDGVQRSTTYPGGLALRFARVKGYREDKAAGEADTIEQLRQRIS